MSELFLIFVTFVASTTAAVVGLGGGILLISVMPGLIPTFAIIPVHGMVQIFSNLTRTLFGLRHMVWSLFAPFVVGAVLGAAVGSMLVVDIRSDYLPVVIGCFILLITWAPAIRSVPQIPGKFGIIGAVQTFLSLFVGVVGPLNMPFLIREGLSRDRLVITHSTQMTAGAHHQGVNFLLAWVRLCTVPLPDGGHDPERDPGFLGRHPLARPGPRGPVPKDPQVGRHAAGAADDPGRRAVSTAARRKGCGKEPWQRNASRT